MAPKMKRKGYSENCYKMEGYHWSKDNSDEDEDLGLSLEKLDLGPRKKLLVLCLGGLLVERIRLRAGTARYGGRRPDAVWGNFLIYKRPFCDEFLKFCFQRFEVEIWSGALKRNIDGVVRHLTPDLRGKFAFVWDQKQCTDSGYKSLTKAHKPIFLKELKKIWNNEGPILPWPTGTYSSANTLLIDTEPCTALLNPPNTAIFPYEYKADQTVDAFLGPNGDLQAFLNGLGDADDVPSYVEKHALGQPTITPLHRDWKYYREIIKNFRKAYADSISFSLRDGQNSR